MTFIWVPRKTNRDLSTAKKFGKICTIFSDDVSPHDVHRQYEILCRDVAPAITAKDFVLTVGPTIMVVNVCMMMQRKTGKVRILTYDNRKRSFIMKTLE